MDKHAKDNITGLLESWRKGNPISGEKLMSLIYPELRKIAHAYLQKEGKALHTTELVHEAYLRLARRDDATWQNRAHFYGFAARIMRQILVEYARAQLREKRGGGLPDLQLDDAINLPNQKPALLIGLDQALADLEKINSRQYRVVELRFFGGLNVTDVAEILSISTGTVKRDWTLARAWLYHYLSSSGPDHES